MVAMPDFRLVGTNRDARSQSIDSFSSTVDVHADANKKPAIVADVSPCLNISNGIRTEDEAPADRSAPDCDGASSDIVVALDSPSRPEVAAILRKHDARLVHVGADLLRGLREAAPDQLAARVGDYNENLMYEMRDGHLDVAGIIQSAGRRLDVDDGSAQDDCGLLDDDVRDFESSLRRALGHDDLRYRGSFMRTDVTIPQPAHVDYDYPILSEHGINLHLAFFPLTEEGCYLQLWQREDDVTVEAEGTVVHIPHGRMLIVPSDTIHGGGFRRGPTGNLRFHLYVELLRDGNTEEEDGGPRLLDRPVNRYTERHDRRRELCERYVDAPGLDRLVGTFFD